jgi:hypothetical protein
VVGIAYMTIPIPNFFFWSGIIEHVNTFFKYLGFVLLVTCSIPLIYDVLRIIFKSDNE